MKYAFATAIIASVIASQQAYADIVHFKNGDVVSGKITNVTPDHVTLKPSFQEDITLKLSVDDIMNLSTDDNLTVEFNDKTLLTGKVSLKNSLLHVSNHTKTYPPKALKEAYEGTYENRHGLKTRGHIRGGLNSVSGNNESQTYDLNGQFIAETEKNRFTTGLEYGFSEAAGTTTRDRTYGKVKYDHFLSDSLYSFANADFERDVLRDLNLRSALGVGLGYRVYNEDDLHLDFEVAPNYVNENFDVTPDQDNDFLALRWSVNYDQKLFEKFTFYHNHRALQSLDNKQDTVINARTGVNVPLFENVQAGIEWRLDWNGNPVAGNKTTDHGYVVNIGYYF